MWSCTVSSWNLYVRILSPRIPDPTCCLRLLAILEVYCEVTILSTCSCIDFIAKSRLFCLLRVWLVATIPLGIWVILQEFWCLLRCCPPAPVPLYHSIFKSQYGISTPCDVCSLLSITATVTVLVWTLPFLSVGGTRWIRWPPHSLFKPDKSVPWTSIWTSPRYSFIRRLVQPLLCANLMYACAKSFTNSLLSSPPSAARISITFFTLLLLSIMASVCTIRPLCPQSLDQLPRQYKFLHRRIQLSLHLE